MTTATFKKSIVREYFESIVIAVILALFVRTFVLQAFKIPTGSMENNLLIGVGAHPEHGQKRFLRNVDLPHPLHALLAFLLLLEQFPLARDIAAIALRENVLAHGRNRLTRDDLISDCGL